jgi:predicted Zn-dependent protease
LSADELARLPFWDGERPLHPVPSCGIDASLEAVPRTTVALLALGPVPPALVEAVGDVLREELDLPACRVDEPLPLPDANRIRGIVVGRQWNADSLVRHFRERFEPLPEAPLKYLLLTGADIYSEGSNFVFSHSAAFGVVLSYARYGDPDAEWETVRHRTAKQALGALVKSFGLPPASDPNCVTSYSNGIPQFDAKGNRPIPSTFRLFRERVEAQDARWRAHLAARTSAG